MGQTNNNGENVFSFGGWQHCWNQMFGRIVDIITGESVENEKKRFFFFGLAIDCIANERI